MQISLKILNNNPYNDTPPSHKYLEEQINEALKEGYQLYGSPFQTKGYNERDVVIHQAMIKYRGNND